MVFTLQQKGNQISGTVEGVGGSFFGAPDGATPIEAGKVEGNSVSFKVGTISYAGSLKGDQIEVQRTMLSPARTSHPAEPSGPRPAIGPPPDGSDPSRGPQIMRPPTSVKVVLRRVNR